MGGDKADELVAIKDKLAGIGVLAQLAILEQLNIQVVRVDFSFHVRSQGGEGIERLGARPLAFGVLDRAVAKILRGSIAEDITGGGSRRGIVDAAADDDTEFRFVIGPVFRKRDFDFAPIGDYRGGGLEPEKRLFRQREACLRSMVGIIRPTAIILEGTTGGSVRNPLSLVGFLSNEGEPKTSPCKRKTSPSMTLAKKISLPF